MLWFDNERNYWVSTVMTDPYPQEAVEGQQLVNLESKDMKVLQLDGTWKLLGPFDVRAYERSRFEQGDKVEEPKVYEKGEPVLPKEETRTKVTQDPDYDKARAEADETVVVEPQPEKKVVVEAPPRKPEKKEDVLD